MIACLIDDAILASFVRSCQGPVTLPQIEEWAAAHGEPLNVVSWADASPMLAGEALADLPAPVGDLYVLQTLHSHPVDHAFAWIGYLDPARAADLLRGLPDPGFDDPAPEVYAAREELEGWLTKATRSNKGLLLIWN